MIKIGIVGGTGYTGVELLRLLAQHPEADVRTITSRKDAGTAVADMFPSLRGRYALAFVDPADAHLEACDVVFFATPHGVAMAQARELVAAGARIIDLAADGWNQEVVDVADAHDGHRPRPACLRELGELVGGGGQVEAHDVVDHDAVGQAVVQVRNRRQRVRA